jgi:protein-histidine N-methyltransferase
MAEEDLSEAGAESAAPATATIDASSDLTAGIYEGGFKVWECSLDLVSHLSSHFSSSAGITQLTGRRIIELGAGAALPSLYLFSRVLQENVHNVQFLLSDFNTDVLSLVTVPNLLLVWIFCSTSEAASKARVDAGAIEPSGEVDVTPDLTKAFLDDLKAQNITVRLISGSWSPQFVTLVGTSDIALVLASETIYSPASLAPFVDTLLGFLYASSSPSNSAGNDKAEAAAITLVAAKQIYFGVGGGVEEFRHALDLRTKSLSKEIKVETVLEVGKGVGRVVLDIRAT